MSRIIKIIPPENDGISTVDFKESVYYPFLIDKDEIELVDITYVKFYGGNSPNVGMIRYRVDIHCKGRCVNKFMYTDLELAIKLLDIICDMIN